MSFLKCPWTNLCYTLSMSSLPLPSSFRASPSLAASSTWANISAIRASSSLFLTLYTSSSCFLHTNTTGSGYGWQLQLPVNSHWNSIQQMVYFFFFFLQGHSLWTLGFLNRGSLVIFGWWRNLRNLQGLSKFGLFCRYYCPTQTVSICCWALEFKVEVSISRAGNYFYTLGFYSLFLKTHWRRSEKDFLKRMFHRHTCQDIFLKAKKTWNKEQDLYLGSDSLTEEKDNNRWSVHGGVLRSPTWCPHP